MIKKKKPKEELSMHKYGKRNHSQNYQQIWLPENEKFCVIYKFKTKDTLGKIFERFMINDRSHQSIIHSYKLIKWKKSLNPIENGQNNSKQFWEK